jgi:signal transduction histidine kinase
MKLTVQYRLTLLFTGVMALLLFSANIIMYNLSSGYREQNFFRSLEDRAKILFIAYQNEAFKETLNELKDQHIHRIYEAEDMFIEVDPEGGFLLPDSEPPLTNDFVEEIMEKGSAWIKKDGKSYAGVRFSDQMTNQVLIVVSAAVDIKGNAYRKKLRASLAGAFLVAVLTMVITSLIFSRRLFNPVLRMIQSVNSINAFNLGTRLEKEGFVDEIAELKDTFNDMLGRIDEAFKTQQKFIGNTTHSLRTPLTIIMGEVELAMAKLDKTHELYESLETINQEAEKLNQIVNTLLELARSGTGKQKREWGMVRIDELIKSIYDAVMRMDNSYKLKISPPSRNSKSIHQHVTGNESLLNLALTNIVLNGIKYSDNNLVKIAYFFRGNKVYIKIIDKGIGIPKDDIPNIFLPYFRSKNTNSFDGFGIGLPLTMDIIRMHGGQISVLSKLNFGTVFTVELPLATQAFSS